MVTYAKRIENAARKKGLAIDTDYMGNKIVYILYGKKEFESWTFRTQTQLYDAIKKYPKEL